MANPAIKDGYFPIANELAEQFAMKNIPGNEMRILWVVLRKTWGWRKDTDRIAFSQFAEATGMKNGNVSRSIKSLVAKRLLIENNHFYKLNQDYKKWKVAKRLPNKKGSQSDSKSSQKATKKVAKRIVTKDIKTLTKDKSKIVKTILQGKQWNDLIDSFKPVNPMYEKFYKSKTERIALNDLVKADGYEKILKVIQFLPKVIGRPFAPKITKPTELVRDYGKLQAYCEQEKNKFASKAPNI